MQIHVENREGFALLQLLGEFDSSQAGSLKKQVQALEENGMAFVVLNLSQVRFIDSTAMGAIIKSARSLKGQGGQLAVSAPGSFLRELFEISGLDREVSIYDTDEEAGRGLQGESAGPGNAVD